MNIKDIKGLRFPDEYVVKFFFKESLHNIKGKVLEYGCGNGNNLALFYSFNFNVTGVDFDPELISFANENFSKLKTSEIIEEDFTFHHDDIRNTHGKINEQFDVILFPNVLYYIDHNDIVTFFDKLASNPLIKKNGFLFFRMRNTDDYRFGKGKPIGRNCFKLDIKETGELGCINTFFSEEEFVTLIRSYYSFKSLKIMKSRYDNIQNDKLINNSDIIIWGQLNG